MSSARFPCRILLPRLDPGRASLSDAPIEARRRPTMVDVAALAGVALKTVSRVGNSDPGVSPELEARVKRAIEQLNYRRDANAATVRRPGGKPQQHGLAAEERSTQCSTARPIAI